MSPSELNYSYGPPQNEVCTFLEISASTLSRDLGYKGKEGYIRQRSAPKAISPCLPTTYHSWNWQWLVVRDNYIAFFDGIEQRHPRDVFLIQENTRVKKVEPRKRETLLHNHYAFVLINDQREIQIRTESLRQLNEWMADINRVIKASAWTIPHRFNSFAPVRLHGQARAFVDGEDYFKHAADAIMIAKDTIYIRRWGCHVRFCRTAVTNCPLHAQRDGGSHPRSI